MVRQAGFTLLELLVTLSIVGILFVTSIPIYNTWQQRAYGSEAAIMLKQLMDAEIAYYLENNKFFPEDTSYFIPHSGDPTPAGTDVKKEIQDNLNINIRSGHFLEYTLVGDNTPGSEGFFVTIASRDLQFDIFKGTPLITGSLYKDGTIEYVYPSY